ncbi:DUF6301 family protein [Yinghuangia soli]|uniref:DUF6301 family protein n=1 Tax=Yinghuangia soli TaxID=2908204 RepID=A0AA41QAF7_9ACTN|nr:DUF6301 family protein [Yinghuangia soli]MCF2533334.1 DUF6301 family protein [Yinghuangia soli]
MAKLFSTAPGTIGETIIRFLAVPAPLTEGEFESLLGSLGWRVQEREASPPVYWVEAHAHPELLGRAEASVESGALVYIDLPVTESVDEDDEDGQAQLTELARRLFAEVPRLIPGPHRQHGQRITWPGACYDVSLSRAADQVGVVVESRGDSPTPAVDSGAERDPWRETARGLGRLMSVLSDLDRIELLVRGTPVVDISRAADVLWILATGPDDSITPVELSPAQRSALLEMGFFSPEGEEYPGQPNTQNYWYAGELPSTNGYFDWMGQLVVSALRDVYGAGEPGAVSWCGVALSDDASRTLRSLDLAQAGG